MKQRRGGAIQPVKGLKRDGSSTRLMTFRPEAGILALSRDTHLSGDKEHTCYISRVCWPRQELHLRTLTMRWVVP